MIGRTNSGGFGGSGGSKYEQLVNYQMLYNHGDTCDKTTGGWSIDGCVYYVSGTNGKGYSYSTGTLNADHITVKSTATSDMNAMSTVNAVDVSDYNATYFLGEVTAISSTANPVGLGIGMCTDKANYCGTMDMHNLSFNSVRAKQFGTIDISTITGTRYVSVFANRSGSTGNLYAMFLTKVDPWSTLASKAGITATSISDILTASEALLTNEDAVDFMVRQCTGDFMVSAIQNSTFLTALDYSPYKTVIQANEHWAKFLAMVA